MKIMMELDYLRWNVMDATADDWESLEQIILHFAQWCGRRDPAELAGAIESLVLDGMMKEMKDRSFVAAELVQDPGRLWFSMTPEGRCMWDREAPRFENIEGQQSTGGDG